jgi:hypothetical protein
VIQARRPQGRHAEVSIALRIVLQLVVGEKAGRSSTSRRWRPMPSFGLERARSRGRRKGAGKPALCGILRVGQFSVRGQLKRVAKRHCNSRCQTPRSVHRAGRRLDFDVSF